MHNASYVRIFPCIVLLGASALAGFASEKGALQVGAAKVDITPAEDAALPMSGYAGRKEGFQKIHDHIYARAIVLSDGTNQAALMTWEVIGIPTRVWEDVSQRIAKQSGIPVENLLLAGVHDHGAPSLAGMYGEASPKSVAYTAKVTDAALEAVRQAKANLQPARIGYGAGKAYVNINRRQLTPGRGWWLGFNPEGASDKTVAVLRFETMAGKPIAFYINYPVHAVVMGPDNYQVTGDLAGATSRFVEQYYSGKKEFKERSDAGYNMRLRPEEVAGDGGVVAVWTSGAAGDQNPVALARDSDFTMVDALGQILGEEVVRVAGTIKTTPQARISGVQKVITCPGRKLGPGPRPRKEYIFEDADPVDIRLGLLMINDIALAGVSGEALTEIYQHLKRETPFNHTIMVTHANGSSGYIPNDAAFDQISYEIATSHLKPGCAENGIVNGFLDLMSRF